jgi:hypothetical protein
MIFVSYAFVDFTCFLICIITTNCKMCCNLHCFSLALFNLPEKKVLYSGGYKLCVFVTPCISMTRLF